MRKRTKTNAAKLNLYLSEGARTWIETTAERREVSKSQVVEDLVVDAKGKAAAPQSKRASSAAASLALDSTPMLGDVAKSRRPSKPQRQERPLVRRR